VIFTQQKNTYLQGLTARYSFWREARKILFLTLVLQQCNSAVSNVPHVFCNGNTPPPSPQLPSFACYPPISNSWRRGRRREFFPGFMILLHFLAPGFCVHFRGFLLPHWRDGSVGGRGRSSVPTAGALPIPSPPPPGRLADPRGGHTRGPGAVRGPRGVEIGYRGGPPPGGGVFPPSLSVGKARDSILRDH